MNDAKGGRFAGRSLMSPRVKKAALLVLKIAILAGLLDYARRQSQLDDEIAVEGAAEPPGAAVVLRAADGTTTEVERGARLKVVELRRASDGSPLAYRASTKEGTLVDIPAAEVERDVAAKAARPFSLLPGMRTLFDRLDVRYLAFAFAAFGPALFLMAVRWRILLVASGVRVPFWILVRLHYMAFFFNTFMPGGAGGDIIKAVYVARHSEQKAEAATMVLIDRVVGLVGLLIMAGGVVLLDYEELHGIAIQVGTVSVALLVLGGLFFSSSVRKFVRYDAIVERLPKAAALKRADAALLALLGKKAEVGAALALTLALQFAEIVGVWFAGQALGLHQARFVHYVAFVPIGYLFNALPISFGGLGLMEGAYLKLFRDAGVATATQGFMLGALARAIVVGWSLVGALSAIFPPERAERAPSTAGAQGSSL